MYNPPEDTSSEQQFHPISCKNCKRLHKTCNKRYPTCSGCEWRNIRCEYEKPKRVTNKKKTKSEVTSIQWIANTEQKTSDNMDPLSDWIEIRKYIDQYFTILHEIKFIEKEELELYMLRSDNSAQLPNFKQIRALFYCIVAHLTQILALECADDSLNRAVEAVREFFNEYSNFYVACSYGLLALVEVGYGRVKNARFYLKFVDFYMDELAKEDRNNYYVVNLQKLQIVVCVDAKFDSSVSCVVRDWFYILGKYIGIELPKEWKDFIVQEIDENNYILFIQMLQALIQIGKLNLKDEKTVRFYNETADMLYHGIRIRILTEMNKSPELVEESALKIVHLTESDMFSVSPGFLSNSIAASAKVILHIVRLIEMGHRKNCDEFSIHGPINYFQILSKIYRGLQIMGKRFRKVFLLQGSTIKEIEIILNQYSLNSPLTRVDMNNISSENSGPSITEFFQIISANKDTSEYERMQYERNVFNILQHIQLPNSKPTSNYPPMGL
ncbi:predicted protein [Naegleria gruberi]|uniref:Predicted protein n=1 Tax=Naegleria gruberi TaxID=5762 RepID=D2UYA4_NAEGR|nr:uncharacterized protein NAEGRDRAFT_61403 [Naegleria gruberi]EFC50437.1 predicted protein [Naegleria gruberi]|eukprot:XP_002683181.1 predicted protein [Naegleria gruberi strain NEG-M]